MKLGEPSRLVREALPDAPAGEWIDLLLAHINKKGDETTQALTQNLTIADNMNAAIVTYRMTHATERTIKNPLKGRPVGIKAIRSAAIAGGTRYTVDSVDWRFVESTNATDPQQLGIAVNYAAPHGVCSIYRSAAYNFPDAVSTAVPFDTTSFSSGSLSYDTTNTAILCAKPGYVYASYAWNITPNATGGRRAMISKNNSIGTELWGRENDSPSATIDTGLAGGGLIEVAAGDLLQVFGFQNSGGVLALALGQGRTKLDAHYVAPPATAQNDVSFVVYGG